MTSGAPRTAVNHGRCSPASKVVAGATSNGSLSIRPTARATVFSTRQTMALTAVAVACNFNVPLTVESPGSHRLSFLIHLYTGALTWTRAAMFLLAVG